MSFDCDSVGWGADEGAPRCKFLVCFSASRVSRSVGRMRWWRMASRASRLLQVVVHHPSQPAVAVGAAYCPLVLSSVRHASSKGSGPLSDMAAMAKQGKDAVEEQWVCPRCMAPNPTKFFYCRRCTTMRDVKTWMCPACHAGNDVARTVCSRCSAERMVSVKAVRPPPLRKTWSCRCGNANEVSNDVCLKCGIRRSHLE